MIKISWLELRHGQEGFLKPSFLVDLFLIETDMFLIFFRKLGVIKSIINTLFQLPPVTIFSRGKIVWISTGPIVHQSIITHEPRDDESRLGWDHHLHQY